MLSLCPRLGFTLAAGLVSSAGLAARQQAGHPEPVVFPLRFRRVQGSHVDEAGGVRRAMRPWNLEERNLALTEEVEMEVQPAFLGLICLLSGPFLPLQY